MNVEYKYTIGQHVVTPFDSEGFVSMLGFDEGGAQYHVKTKDKDRWYREAQLKTTREQDAIDASP